MTLPEQFTTGKATMSKNQHLMVNFTSKPGHETDLKSVLLRLVKASRAESGCIRYELAQRSNNPGQLFLVEQWASEESLRDHQQTSHFIEGIKNIEALVTRTDVHFVNWVETD